ncbi:MAG: UDP-2,3-diacylglucosamine diphosphatase LpxI [Holosporales bacterium]|jgi:DUF1009 family protein|nr:UDP-2,3-diacylglucosamine diphosphatase LpxI [Holosporales bacterium]
MQVDNLVAVIAGSGDLPLRIISKLNELKRQYVVLSIEGYGPPEYKQFKLGHLRDMLDFIGASKAKELLFCGAVKRPSLSSLDLDSVGKKWLKQLGIRALLGDNSLIKGIRKLIELEGFRIISPIDILNTLLAPEGLMTDVRPSEIDMKDIARGVFVLNAISKADVGQAVVVEEGIVLGIEAAEGTRALLARCLDLKLKIGKGGVLVKMPKSNQDQSIDFPTIGRSTIMEAENSKLSGIAVGAWQSQIIDSEDTVRLANEKGIFLIGI